MDEFRSPHRRKDPVLLYRHDDEDFLVHYNIFYGKISNQYMDMPCDFASSYDPSSNSIIFIDLKFEFPYY